MRLFEKYRNATMVPLHDFVTNVELIGSCCHLSGAFVECGTWRGGMAAAMMEIGGPARKYVFFDSFAGLPPPTEADGPSAAEYAAQEGNRDYRNNCAAYRTEFDETIARSGFSDHATVHEGWFKETLPTVSTFPIAVLRIDCDWYEPTLCCLRKFWGSVESDGIIILDDYYAWDGCARAVHQFFAENDLAARLSARGCTAYVRKP